MTGRRRLTAAVFAGMAIAGVAAAMAVLVTGALVAGTAAADHVGPSPGGPLLGRAEACAPGTGSDCRAPRMLFTGDILLDREVAHEIAARGGTSPWRDMRNVLRQADFVFGNLEGTVGDAARCAEPRALCFAVDARLLPLLRQAGFTAVGIANNHSGDLGPEGREATRAAITAAGMAPISSALSPAFFRLGDRTLALINLSLVPGRDGVLDAVPSWQAAQQLRLARALADWVIVSVHWGKELADWVVPEQESQARWLIAQGADLIIGSHPHVVQPAACLDGKPVFYSLGNHVFDQKYPITKRGLIADCRIAGDRLTCHGLTTETPQGSSFPRLLSVPDAAGAALSQCTVAAGEPLRAARIRLRPWTSGTAVVSAPLVLEGISPTSRWRSTAKVILAAAIGTLAPDRPPLLLTVERHPSPIDGEDGPRPYVYEVTEHGLVARWRGSALAWPLLDATLIADPSGRSYVCALHRGDSFLMLGHADSTAPRTQLYAWNGFGFSSVVEPTLTERCAHAFGEAEIRAGDLPARE